MTDEAELEYEATLSRDDIATHLEAFAESLRGTDEIEFDVGGKTARINPPAQIEFEVELEDEPEDDGVERSIEFELEWMRGDDESELPV